MSEKKIRIQDGGPYIVEGGVPLFSESLETDAPDSYVWDKREDITPKSKSYRICRCGKSTHMPFCDNTHEEIGFEGKERASRDLFEERAMLFEGKGINVADDMDLCSLSRFCHTPKGRVWALLEKSDDPEVQALLLKGVQECPSGRLVARDPETGEDIEPELPLEVVVTQDPNEGCSGPLVVRGGIPIEAPDGYIYEVRNRVALCRCGRSHNTPFCDARHIATRFDDGRIDS